MSGASAGKRGWGRRGSSPAQPHPDTTRVGLSWGQEGLGFRLVLSGCLPGALVLPAERRRVHVGEVPVSRPHGPHLCRPFRSALTSWRGESWCLPCLSLLPAGGQTGCCHYRLLPSSSPSSPPLLPLPPLAPLILSLLLPLFPLLSSPSSSPSSPPRKAGIQRGLGLREEGCYASSTPIGLD